LSEKVNTNLRTPVLKDLFDFCSRFFFRQKMGALRPGANPFSGRHRVLTGAKALFVGALAGARNTGGDLVGYEGEQSGFPGLAMVGFSNYGRPDVSVSIQDRTDSSHI
jgi:hypothetical protein